MGDLEPCKGPVDRPETDLQAGGRFEHAGMLEKRRVAVRPELLEELGFVHRGQAERSTARFAHDVQVALPMTFEVPVDRHHIYREQLGGIFDRHPAFDRRHDPFPQHQVVSRCSNNLYLLIMLNALVVVR